MNKLKLGKLLGKSKKKKNSTSEVPVAQTATDTGQGEASDKDSPALTKDDEDRGTAEDTSDERDYVLRGHEKEENAFYEKLRANAESFLKREVNEEEPAAEVTDNQQEGNLESWLEKVVLSCVLNVMLNDYRGSYPELRRLETIVSSILDYFKERTGITAASLLPDETAIDVQLPLDLAELHREFQAAYKTALGNHVPSDLQEDQFVTDEAISTHLGYSILYLKSVGSYGSFKVKEIIALHRLANQAKIMKVITEAADSGDIGLEDFPELQKRRNLLEFWRSCSDGEDKLAVNAKIVCLELESEFGREIRRKHPDVAQRIFPELVNRIVGQTVTALEKETVTIFQILQYVDDMSPEGETEEFSKLIEKLALEMFLNSALTSDNDDLILVAIQRVGKLLALRLSNLCVLSHLLLSRHNNIRSSAAERIIQISKEVSLRDKALISFAELLESTSKKDRQCACLALGFLRGRECTPQLTYLSHGDLEVEVREAAAHALVVFGDEGKLALEHAAGTLLAQTNTQLVSSKTRMRLGTAL